MTLWRHFNTQNSTFVAFWTIFCRFQPFFNNNMEITPIKPCSLHSGDFWKNFSHKFLTSLDFWRQINLPKQHFLNFLEKILQISEFYSNITSIEIIYNFQEVILKQIFPKKLHRFCLLPSFWSLKQHFWAFWRIFDDE